MLVILTVDGGTIVGSLNGDCDGDGDGDTDGEAVGISLSSSADVLLGIIGVVRASDLSRDSVGACCVVLVDSGVDDMVDIGFIAGYGGNIRTVSAIISGVDVGDDGLCVGCGSTVFIGVVEDGSANSCSSDSEGASARPSRGDGICADATIEDDGDLEIKQVTTTGAGISDDGWNRGACIGARVGPAGSDRVTVSHSLFGIICVGA